MMVAGKLGNLPELKCLEVKYIHICALDTYFALPITNDLAGVRKSRTLLAGSLPIRGARGTAF
jgi:hypothetical protein